MPSRREAGRVTSPGSFTPSDVILNPLFSTDVWLLRSGSHFPKHFSIHPGLELGFYITGSGCLPRILPAARLTSCPGSQPLLSHRTASLTWAHLPRILWLGFSTPNTSSQLLPPQFSREPLPGLASSILPDPLSLVLMPTPFFQPEFTSECLSWCMGWVLFR